MIVVDISIKKSERERIFDGIKMIRNSADK